jgi:hypothetical protein
MTKAQFAILWGLAALVVCVFVALSYVLAQPGLPLSAPPAAMQSAAGQQTAGQQTAQVSTEAAQPQANDPDQVYRLPQTPYSAQSLSGLAEQTARQWQPDAGLVSAAASWPFADLDGFSMPVDWTFQFYSPDTQRIYVINVNQAQVTPIRETLSPYPLATVTKEQWQVDSYQALNAWLNDSGGDFLHTYPVVDVSMRLRSKDDKQPQWVVTGVTGDGQTAKTVRLDASASALP